jgi:dihydropteroate synthase
MLLQACDQQIRFPRPALVMGVVNVTPDSFSDGGRFFEPSTAVEHALKLVEQGADIIDIGGESTRPNATLVAEDEELRRVLPVIEELKRRCGVSAFNRYHEADGCASGGHGRRGDGQ